jgi:hypothetical protein
MISESAIHKVHFDNFAFLSLNQMGIFENCANVLSMPPPPWHIRKTMDMLI